MRLKPGLLLPFCLLLHYFRGQETGITFAESTKLADRNRVFPGLAKPGRSTMGWFFGFKLHLLINPKGQLMAFSITTGNKDDRKPLDAMSAALQGKIFSDKGYLSQLLLERLRQQGLHLVNGIGRNMKNHLMPLVEKVLLRKRCIIESLFDKIKSSMGVEHSRQRSPINALVHALVHILSSLAAYTLAQPKVKIGKVPIAGPVPNLPSLSSPYPQWVT